MALFSRNKETEEKVEETTTATETAKKPQVTKQAQPSDRNLAGIIARPRITEKAVELSGKNVYTFEVHKDATKLDVKEAVKSIYNVTPVSVNIVNKRPRKYSSRTRGRVISEKGMKKAYVYLKQGDSINLV